MPNFPTFLRSLHAAVRPSWRLLLFIAMAWAWRLAMVDARLDWPTTPATRLDLLRGLLWDAALWTGLLWVAQAHGLWFAGAPQRQMRWLAALGLGPVLAWAVLCVPLRALDYGHCYMVRAHFSSESFVYLQGGFDQVWFAPRTMALTALMLALMALHAALVIGEFQRGTRLQLQTAHGDLLLYRRLALAMAVLGLVAGGRAVSGQLRTPPHPFAHNIQPEINLIQQFLAYRDAPPRPTALAQVPAERWQRWQHFGLVPKGARADADYPLWTDHLAEPPLTLPLRPGAPDQPNVVLTLMESTSSVFSHALSGHFRGLTPQLDRLTQQMTVVDGYHNTTSPTIAGTVASLCSVFPSTHPADLGARKADEQVAKLSCLPALLAAHGYRVVYVGGGDTRQAGTDVFLRNNGFSEVHAAGEIAKRFPGSPSTVMGLRDDVVVAYAIEQIQRLEELRTKDKRPYLLLIATLDAHEPGLAPPEVTLPQQPSMAVEGVPDDPDSRKQLTAYYWADQQIGKLADCVLAPERRDQTLWLLTSDHAPFRTKGNQLIFKDKSQGWSFNRLPLLIHDPRHQLPARVQVLSGSLDIAPTLLHLLDQLDHPNAMLGASIFGRRPQLPWLVGRIGTRSAWLHTATADRELPTGLLRQLCEQKQGLAIGPDLPNACDVSEWLDWQDQLWQTRRWRR